MSLALALIAAIGGLIIIVQFVLDILATMIVEKMTDKQKMRKSERRSSSSKIEA